MRNNPNPKQSTGQWHRIFCICKAWKTNLDDLRWASETFAPASLRETWPLPPFSNTRPKTTKRSWPTNIIIYHNINMHQVTVHHGSSHSLCILIYIVSGYQIWLLWLLWCTQCTTCNETQTRDPSNLWEIDVWWMWCCSNKCTMILTGSKVIPFNTSS